MVRPKLGARLADTINNGLISQDDQQKLLSCIKNMSVLLIILNLRVYKMNEKVIISEHDLTKEDQLIKIQQNVTTTICIIADILNDQSKVNYNYERR